ncbi:hypothetical protein C6Y40_08975 [Alteromonas alba]|uniref:Glycosyl transferase family 2 n=1 Tax=Alteromonas alba TaxID=2079529 RepID=A0A2S9VBX5_9ALTE|nr:glycosyltransferase family 2 protein [Alteromonas alba]PRO73943.1 hypothetical protein C6Y40_08975 [Alteromonas alba]
MSSRNSAIKVKLVAIAKDECAYLADWIFHHLYAGFAEIEIYINRTRDKSVELLEELSALDSRISWDRSDFVDMVPGSAHTKMQYITYALAYQKIIDDKNSDITHLMYLDIDEFWLHENPDVKISDFIKQAGRDVGISFCWINDYPTSDVFSPLRKEIMGIPLKLVKSVFPVKSALKMARPHQPLLKEHQYIMADGTKFNEDPSIKEHSTRHVGLPAFVYHRCLRSPTEYVSSLYRGRPGYKDVSLKTNRSGLPGSSEKLVTYTLNNSGFERYEQARESFMQRGNINQLKASGEEYVLQRFAQAVVALENSLPESHGKMLKLFANVNIPSVTHKIEAYHDELISRYSDKVELIRELALKAEAFSIFEARRIMSKALALRPEGPVINAKIKEYNEALAK